MGVNALLNGIWTRQDYLAYNATLNTTNSQVRIEDIANNTNAKKYYEEAANLKREIQKYGLDKIQAKDAKGADGTDLKDVEDNNKKYFDGDETFIFEELFNTDGIGKDKVGIEEKDSNFNDHRLKIIKHCIESELMKTINNFNTFSTSSNKFQMPKLKETEWDMIYDNISVLTFLQGLNIGGRIYNGHSVVPNNNNKELVSENDIQFVSGNKIYDATFSGFVGGGYPLDVEKGGESHGYAKNTLSRASTEDRETGVVQYFYRYPLPAGQIDGPWFSYESIVTSQKNNTDLKGFNSIFDYIDSINNNDIRDKYYLALGRERYGMFRVENEDFVSEYTNP